MLIHEPHPDSLNVAGGVGCGPAVCAFFKKTFLFGCVVQHAGSQFPDQGSNLSPTTPDTGSTDYQPLGCQGSPGSPCFNEPSYAV